MGEEKRLFTLDYLRGLAAFGIMMFHYLGWTYGNYDSDSFLGRFGIYGVAVFYVLSGLTLYHVYYHKMALDTASLKNFFIKRLFRIFPLLWLVMLITALFITKDKPDAYELFLNFTGLFSVLEWEEYIGVGVWSIGNELVFYLLFPVFILLSKRNSTLFYVLCTLLLALYVYFAFYVLYEKYSLVKQWSFYINPLNQVFLFLGGYLIGLWSEKWKVSSKLSYALFVLSALLFVFYPVEGDAINLVTDTNRMVFTALCFIICFAFYKLDFKLPALADKYLKMLGEASYSVYLLHPIVWFLSRAAFAVASKYSLLPTIPPLYHMVASVIITLMVSYHVYHRYERSFMRRGKCFAQTYGLARQ